MQVLVADLEFIDKFLSRNNETRLIIMSNIFSLFEKWKEAPILCTFYMV